MSLSYFSSAMFFFDLWNSHADPEMWSDAWLICGSSIMSAAIIIWYRELFSLVHISAILPLALRRAMPHADTTMSNKHTAHNLVS